MVSCTLEGGLGNIMFQIAAVLSYAKKHGMDYLIPPVTGSPRWKHYKFRKIKYGVVDIKGFYHYKHHDIFYEQRPYNIRFSEIPYHENILVRGHFLSKKYFEQHEESIVSMFDFKWRYRPATIAVHTRVGDYKKLSQHLPVLPLKYYQDAIDLAFDKTGINELLVFGEDIEHNQKYFTQKNFPYIKKINFSVGKNEIEDIELMSGCPVLIAANSTYSLWAHILNQHRYKMLIGPKQYYGPAYGYVDTTDLWPEQTHLV